MARIAVLTDSHGPENLEVIAKAMSKQGVNTGMHLGDHAYKLASDITANQTSRAEQTLIQLLQPTVIHEEALAGDFSEAQLKEVIKTHNYGRDMLDKVHAAELKQTDSIFKSYGVTLEAVLGGNHDRNGREGSKLPKPLSDTFGDRFLNGTVRDVKGHKVLGLSGGGSKPSPAQVLDGTMADDELRNVNQSAKWGRPVVTEETLDMLISHVPPTMGKGEKRENAVEHLKQYLFQRREAGLKSPKVIMSGHTHTRTIVSYNEELDALWVQPGTAGYNHNNGDHGSFVVVNTDDTTKEIKSVEEYRIYNKDNGTQEVEHYGTHRVDLSQKKLEDRVKFKSVKKVVIDGHKREYKDFRTMDLNHKLLQEGITLDYAKIKSAKKKEETLLHNLSLSQVYTDRVKTTFKDIIDTERRELSIEKGDEESKNSALNGLRKNVYMKLSDLAAKMFHTTYAELHDIDPTIDEHIHRDSMLFRAYGVREYDINSLVTIDKATRVDDFAYNFGSQLIEKAMKSTLKDWQSKILSGLSAQDFQAMAELHLSQKVERKWDIRSREEALQFWEKSNEQGLITSQNALETAMYQEKKGYKSKERSEDDLYKLLGAEDIQQQFKNMPDPKTVVTKQVQDAIDQGGYPIFSDDEGDYCIGKGTKKRLNEVPLRDGISLGDIRDKLRYTPMKLKDALDQKRAVLFKKGGDEKTYVGLPDEQGQLTGYIPLNKSEKIDLNNYEVSEINASEQERQQLSQKQIQEYLRRLQAQQGNQQYQDPQNDVTLGERNQPQNTLGRSNASGSGYANTGMSDY
ncbi:hypothetical protein COV12_01340 [Candidatus Woesearchaeota archaeon CG10_big_fil_rev_8_21_14_0_10_32_24]|nr:MAG: hypothetical protein COV12_01340 [Candidatus Woesearchaeota archaeon CG10_big_fil_rev_8_21_14_0_10_32_24]